MITFLQRRVLFPTHLVKPLPNAGRNVVGLERLSLQTGEGEVEAYFLPGAGVDDAHPGPLVLYAHGNGELIDYWTEPLAPYRQMGISVLLPEFRGYGRSAGRPSEATIVADLMRFYDLGAARSDVDQARIFFHGRSLGGGVVCSLARHRHPRALILESTFTSVPQLARTYFVPAFLGSLVADRFDSLELVSSFAGPILIAHGRADRVVPFAHGEALFRASRDATMLCYACGHNDCPDDPAAHWASVAQFLARANIMTPLVGETAKRPLAP